MSIELDPTAEIHLGEITFLWVAGYYSGVLSGFARWKGNLCYFGCCDDTTDQWKYTLHSLTEDEARKEVRKNEDFKAVHGDHNEMLPDGSNAGGSCRTTLLEAAAAADAISAAMKAGSWRPPVTYYINPIVGWFTPLKYLNT